MTFPVISCFTAPVTFTLPEVELKPSVPVLPAARPAKPVSALSARQIQRVLDIANKDRGDLIKAIKTSLRTRSGKTWSVTGGTGTAYGWIKITAPPVRRTAHSQLKAGATTTNPSDYETVDTGVIGGSMTQADQDHLSRLMGCKVYRDGVSIPSQNDARRVYVCRALYGHPGHFTWEANWD